MKLDRGSFVRIFCESFLNGFVWLFIDGQGKLLEGDFVKEERGE